MQCGTDHGVACGTCAGKTICDPMNHCQAVCVNKDCGVDQGVACGTCNSTDYCEAADGKCHAACMGMNCGVDHGVSCGECAGKAYCTTSNTCAPACVNLGCGTDHGIACGTCGADTTCESQKCVTCPSGKYFCEGSLGYLCYKNSASRSVIVSCNASQFCDAAWPDLRCTSIPCTPSSSYCTPNGVLTTCNAQGTGGVAGGVDCKATGLDCTEYGCGRISQFVEGGYAPQQLGSAVAPFTTGNIYEVTKGALLVKFSFYVKPYNDQTITWLVAVGDAWSGPFTKVFSKTTTVLGNRLDRYEGPGVVNTNLTAGRFYLIAMQAKSNAVTDIYEGASYDPEFGRHREGYWANTALDDNFPSKAVSNTFTIDLYSFRVP